MMSIDFHSEQNRYTYSNRHADQGWASAMAHAIDPRGKRVADIGCGGGIYSIAWDELGVASVIGIDFSEQMITAAREKSAGRPHVSFQQGRAEATGLPGQSVDVVFERALIHHLETYDACFAEANRLLAPGGQALIQDRTPDDVLIPGSPQHIRGFFFECFPRLQDVEAKRRPTHDAVRTSLLQAGFQDVEANTFWETRRRYDGFEQLSQDLRNRTGRSILHMLSDEELRQLIAFIGDRIGHVGPIVEQDRWTLWTARKAP